MAHLPRLPTVEPWKEVIVRPLRSVHSNSRLIPAVQMRINRLPEEVLLGIFEFLVERTDTVRYMNVWQTLVHVCREWRHIIFSSPRRLNLQLLCMDTNPVRKMLHIWPAFPIVVVTGGDPNEECADNVVAAFEQPGRVSEIIFEEISSQALEFLTGTIHGPFPQLTTLDITLGDTRQFFPEPFPKGFAPRLRSLDLCDVPLSTVSKSMLSASDLVHLSLWHVPIWEYVTPKEIATYLSPMTKLESMSLGLRFPRHYPCSESQRRTVLLALTSFWFEGPDGYLEDLKARLDTPRLNRVNVTHSNSPFNAEDIDYLMRYDYY